MLPCVFLKGCSKWFVVYHDCHNNVTGEEKNLNYNVCKQDFSLKVILDHNSAISSHNVHTA